MFANPSNLNYALSSYRKMADVATAWQVPLPQELSFRAVKDSMWAVIKQMEQAAKDGKDVMEVKFPQSGVGIFIKTLVVEKGYLVEDICAEHTSIAGVPLPPTGLRIYLWKPIPMPPSSLSDQPPALEDEVKEDTLPTLREMALIMHEAMKPKWLPPPSAPDVSQAEVSIADCPAEEEEETEDTGMILVNKDSEDLA